MKFEENVSLAKYSTMRLGGDARYLCEAKNEADVEEAVQFANKNGVEIHVVGGGSNSIFSDDGFDGLVIVNQIPGFEPESHDSSTVVTVGSGEKWDTVVEKSVGLGFSDIAALSLIPGSSGAAPVQNIGAYGQQISDSLISVRAFNLKTTKWEELLRKDCNFAYRTSRFNSGDKGKYIISSLVLRLSRKEEKPPLYAQVEAALKEKGLSTKKVDPQTLRDIVIEIRTKKLPDPSKIANTGSFFKNPVISQEKFKNLLTHYPALKAHKTDDGNLKLYAGQLIELAGLKDYHDKTTGMATWKNQALVLVNEHAKTTADLLAFKQKIVTSVHAAFGITLKQEPELI